VLGADIEVMRRGRCGCASDWHRVCGTRLVAREQRALLCSDVSPWPWPGMLCMTLYLTQAASDKNSLLRLLHWCGMIHLIAMTSMQ